MNLADMHEWLQKSQLRNCSQVTVNPASTAIPDSVAAYGVGKRKTGVRGIARRVERQQP